MASSVLRRYGATIVGGLAIGGVAGVAGSYLVDLKEKADSQPQQQGDVLKKINELASSHGASVVQSGGGGASTSAKPTPPHAPPTPRLERWFKRWYDDSGDMSSLGWHIKKPHPVLEANYDSWLNTKNDEDQRMVLFPLCGASVDLAYLARRGHHVVGVDGVPVALDKLMADYGEEIPSGGGLEPGAMRVRVAQPGWWQAKGAESISTKTRKYTPAPFLFGVQGDFLKFDAQQAGKFGLGEFDAAFDRGGIVAVDPSDRPQYAQRLHELIKPGGRLLLVAVEHDPQFGPPHSVDAAEVQRLFGKGFDITPVGREDKMESEPVWKKRGAKSFVEAAYLCVRK